MGACGRVDGVAPAFSRAIQLGPVGWEERSGQTPESTTREGLKT